MLWRCFFSGENGETWLKILPEYQMSTFRKWGILQNNPQSVSFDITLWRFASFDDWLANISVLEIAEKASYCQHTYDSHMSFEGPGSLVYVRKVSWGCDVPRLMRVMSRFKNWKRKGSNSITRIQYSTRDERSFPVIPLWYKSNTI